MKTRLVLCGVTFAALLLCSGCSVADGVEKPRESISSSPTASPPSPTPSVAPTPTAAPTAVDAGSYASIEEFAAAATAVGIDCSDYRDDTGVAGATAEANCSGAWGLSLYSTVADRNHVLQLNQDSMESGVFLVGPNWLLTKYWGEAADLSAPQTGLGGMIWKVDTPIPAV